MASVDPLKKTVISFTIAGVLFANPVFVQADLGDQVLKYEMNHKDVQVLQEHLVNLNFLNGCPYDNACIESFHAILKKECVYLNTFIDYNHAKLALFQYIEGFYNRKRIHSSINYITPSEYEYLCKVA
ncbi:IS3 family transposase [Schnuerera ultunensis]|uniref:Integrase catalytic domain-containing protein n=1 Tax=[Clostridium] ultunense Esp TaxID=1288971 RepID=A0A1M4PSY0_9FIRM|nr:exported protein of unknown function [[Clostridium] ultunense Esp]